MKGILVHKDGSRTETEYGGGHTVYVGTPYADGHWTETRFEATGTEGDLIVYEERETRDTTQEMREAGERNRAQTMNVVRRGLGLVDGGEVAGSIERIRNIVARYESGEWSDSHAIKAIQVELGAI